MKYLPVFATLCMAFATSTSVASDRGELLYDNHCQECHGKSIHSRENRLVKSPEQLRAWVMAWTVHNGLDWSQEEVSDISAYLNRVYYRFTESDK